MSISIPALLEGILEATAAEAAAKARIASYRAALEDEARRRLDADGAAPTWKAADLGAVRYEAAGTWAAQVADPATFGSYVAEHYPSEATAVLRIPAGALELALEALGFAGLSADQVATAIEVRPAWATTYLASLAVDVERRDDGALDATIADTTTGAIVPGLTPTRSAPKLVVSLDRNRRTVAVEEARTAAAEAITDALGDDAPGPDLVELDQRRRELEGLHGDQLATIAKGHGLGSSGTKAALAERIARAELATGHVIRPASGLPTPADDDALALAHQAPINIEAELIKGIEEGAAASRAEERAAALSEGRSREVLRARAKARGLSAAGTKAEVALRLAEDGLTVDDFDKVTP